MSASNETLAKRIPYDRAVELSLDGQLQKTMDKRLAGLAVGRVGWLSQTPPPFRDLVLARSDLLQFDRTTPIYDAGDDAGGLFGVVEGVLELHLPLDGSETTLAFLGGTGFWSGAFAAVTGDARLIAIAARSSSWLLRLPRAEIVRMTEEYPSAWRHFIELLASNLATTVGIIDALRRNDPLSRLAATLLNLARDLGKEPLLIEASQSDLGSLARLGRSSVNVALADFEQRGWLRRSYRSLEIIDLSALQRFAAEG